MLDTHYAQPEDATDEYEVDGRALPLPAATASRGAEMSSPASGRPRNGCTLDDIERVLREAGFDDGRGRRDARGAQRPARAAVRREGRRFGDRHELTPARPRGRRAPPHGERVQPRLTEQVDADPRDPARQRSGPAGAPARSPARARGRTAAPSFSASSVPAVLADVEGRRSGPCHCGVETSSAPPRRQHARRLADQRLDVRDVLDHLAHRHEAGRAGLERQLLAATQHHLRRRAGGVERRAGRTRPPTAPARCRRRAPGVARAIRSVSAASPQPTSTSSAGRARLHLVYEPRVQRVQPRRVELRQAPRSRPSGRLRGSRTW